VLIPGIESRVEKPHGAAGCWIWNPDASCFAQGTRDTGQRQIVEARIAACRAWLDVVNMERCLLPFLRQLAVFTRIASPIADLARQSGR
jgi:hypothetical protein